MPVAKMLWRVTVALAVMCVGGACNSMGTDVMSRLIVPRDYGVKLCGREFIRAVIFTCGGSRWKRSTEGESGESNQLLSHYVFQGGNSDCRSVLEVLKSVFLSTKTGIIDGKMHKNL